MEVVLSGKEFLFSFCDMPVRFIIHGSLCSVRYCCINTARISEHLDVRLIKFITQNMSDL